MIETLLGWPSCLKFLRCGAHVRIMYAYAPLLETSAHLAQPSAFLKEGFYAR